jgi:uncharacterized membrane protein (DUF373 family)
MTTVPSVLNVAIKTEYYQQQTVLKRLYSESQQIGIAVGAALLAVTRNVFSGQ